MSNELFAQLQQAPVVDLSGVVSASGAAGSRARGEEQWTLVFSLAAWRIAGQVLHVDALTVRQPMHDELFHATRKRIAAYAVLRMRAKVVQQSVLGTPQALLIEPIGPDDADSELHTRMPSSCRSRSPIATIALACSR